MQGKKSILGFVSADHAILPPQHQQTAPFGAAPPEQLLMPLLKKLPQYFLFVLNEIVTFSRATLSYLEVEFEPQCFYSFYLQRISKSDQK